jgi:hypothetical protein
MKLLNVFLGVMLTMFMAVSFSGNDLVQQHDWLVVLIFILCAGSMVYIARCLLTNVPKKNYDDDDKRLLMNYLSAFNFISCAVMLTQLNEHSLPLVKDSLSLLWLAVFVTIAIIVGTFNKPKISAHT